MGRHIAHESRVCHAKGCCGTRPIPALPPDFRHGSSDPKSGEYPGFFEANPDKEFFNFMARPFSPEFDGWVHYYHVFQNHNPA